MATLEHPINVGAARRAMPATARLAYLNTGTSGPLPRPALEAMAAAASDEGQEGRLNPAASQAFRQDAADLRALLAAYVGADGSEIGLTHNTTEGVNIGVWGLNWKADDVCVTTTLEHPGGLLPLYQVHRRYGTQIVFADIGRGERDRTLEAMAQAIRPGVTLVVVSHVAWSTGAVLPLREICDLAHRVGALVCVDGAQSVGDIGLNMHQLGVDVYAFPGQKWLCGPEGTGGLFVRQDQQERIQPTFVGFQSNDHDRYRPDDPSTLEFATGAQRYEVASVYRPGLKGLRASVEWLAAQGPIPRAIEGLAQHCLRRVSELHGVDVLTPSNTELSGLVAFTMEGVDAVACTAYLAERAVAIRSIPDNQALRISCGFFNTPAEIDRTVDLIREFARR
ncbi:MAG: aminotransferase class V-fold PLP-dependent enzyme [Chloroflexota bacterium]